MLWVNWYLVCRLLNSCVMIFNNIVVFWKDVYVVKIK